MRQCVDGMNDQLSIFPKTGQELGREREKDFFESMLPDLREAVKSVNANPEDITYKKCIFSILPIGTVFYVRVYKYVIF